MALYSSCFPPDVSLHGPVFSNMASSEVSEVLGYSEEIVESDMHHIEIHSEQLEMPVECVQEVVTDSGLHLVDSQVIYGDELIVTSEDVPQSEEIVGGAVNDDPIVGLYDSVPVPTPQDTFDIKPFVRKSQKGKRKSDQFFDTESYITENKGKTSHGAWQQKQVSIKTLEGEFSVTMWASGNDEGESCPSFSDR